MKECYVIYAGLEDHLELRRAILESLKSHGAEIVLVETTDFPTKKIMPKIEEMIKIERFEPQRISHDFKSSSKYFTKPKNNFKK